MFPSEKKLSHVSSWDSFYLGRAVSILHGIPLFHLLFLMPPFFERMSGYVFFFFWEGEHLCAPQVCKFFLESHFPQKTASEGKENPNGSSRNCELLLSSKRCSLSGLDVGSALEYLTGLGLASLSPNMKLQLQITWQIFNWNLRPLLKNLMEVWGRIQILLFLFLLG